MSATKQQQFFNKLNHYAKKHDLSITGIDFVNNKALVLRSYVDGDEHFVISEVKGSSILKLEKTNCNIDTDWFINAIKQ